MNIIELNDEIRLLRSKKALIESSISNIQSKIDDIILDLHNHLVDNGLYDYIIYDDEKISDKFNMTNGRLPYIYCGEGDFKSISFELVVNKIKMFYTNTYRDGKVYLISFKIEDMLNMENITNVVISKGIKKLDEINLKKEKMKQNRIDTLKAQLNQLENE